MKIKIVGGFGLQLKPETRAEERALHQINAIGHAHFVCKAFMREKGDKRASLLLTPSLIEWRQPKGNPFKRAAVSTSTASKGK
jgi:hypothetical protein